VSTLYHNSKCSKSRAALEYLTESGISFNIIEYIKNPLNKNEIIKLCKKLNLTPLDIIHTNYQLFKNLNINDIETKGDDFWYYMLDKYPILLERPIYERSYSAPIGRPLKNIINMLSN
jgi:arsenate reductase